MRDEAADDMTVMGPKRMLESMRIWRNRPSDAW
jgi:hypothetical protein